MTPTTPDARPATPTPTPASTDPQYPDRDGKPMADNTLQFKWIVTIKEGLDALFRDQPAVFVGGDLLWYPVLGDPKTRIAPDALVAFGRPKGYRGSYKQWEEAGLAPQVVFEVLSPGNSKVEMRRKLAFYDHFGVEEYYLYDPDRGSLEGWVRTSGALVPVDRIDGFRSPRLGVAFHPGAGPDDLTILRPDGRPLESYDDLYGDREAERARAEAERRRANEERARADDERRRADDERRRADDERRRAERLAARLRELGIDED